MQKTLVLSASLLFYQGKEQKGKGRLRAVRWIVGGYGSQCEREQLGMDSNLDLIMLMYRETEHGRVKLDATETTPFWLSFLFLTLNAFRWGLSVWSLHVLPVYGWVLSWYSSLLPPSKNMHVRLIGVSKIVLRSECVWFFASV